MKKWLSEITNDIRNRWDSKVISRIIYNMMVEVLWLVLWLVERIQDIWLVESAVKLAFVSLKQLSTKQFQANLEESLYCLLRLRKNENGRWPKDFGPKWTVRSMQNSHWNHNSIISWHFLRLTETSFWIGRVSWESIC